MTLFSKPLSCLLGPSLPEPLPAEDGWGQSPGSQQTLSVQTESSFWALGDRDVLHRNVPPGETGSPDTEAFWEGVPVREGGQSGLSGCVRGGVGPSGGYRAVWTWRLLPLQDALHVGLGSQ